MFFLINPKNTSKFSAFSEISFEFSKYEDTASKVINGVASYWVDTPVTVLSLFWNALRYVNAL